MREGSAIIWIISCCTMCLSEIKEELICFLTLLSNIFALVEFRQEFCLVKLNTEVKLIMS